MSSPTIWSTGRYEAVGERIAPIAVEVVDAAKREPLPAAFEAAMRAHSDDAGVRFDAPYVVVTAARR
jgi:hypothetical protein